MSQSSWESGSKSGHNQDGNWSLFIVVSIKRRRSMAFFACAAEITCVRLDQYTILILKRKQYSLATTTVTQTHMRRLPSRSEQPRLLC